MARKDWRRNKSAATASDLHDENLERIEPTPEKPLTIDPGKKPLRISARGASRIVDALKKGKKQS